MFPRLLNPLKTSSFFIFGARATGKSTLLSTIFDPEDAILIDLLDTDTFAALQIKPSRLLDMLKVNDKPWCIIDEVQKIPELLDVVHKQIETTNTKFALTGSSPDNSSETCYELQ